MRLELYFMMLFDLKVKGFEDLKMTEHQQLPWGELIQRIKNGAIKFDGNTKLKIYGQLSCASCKRMKKENRVFFKNKIEARHLGYRLCGHCMRKSYREWKVRTTS